MEICLSSSSSSILNQVVLSAMAALFVICFVNFVRDLFIIFGPKINTSCSKPNKRTKKKKSDRKKKLAATTINPDRNELSVNGESQVKNETQSSNEVPSIRIFTYESLMDATQNLPSDLRISFDLLGEVFRGQMIPTKEEFVIRRLFKYTNTSDEEFVDEVSLLSQASHPNLAKLIGYSVHYDKKLLVYEYVRGGTLENMLHGNQMFLDWKMRMKIALGVAKALEYLHNIMNPPIIHCYIEPSNIWLDEDYTPKLSAFGVVRMYKSFSEPNPPIQYLGSYRYGLHDVRQDNKVTIQTDIFGFGVLLLQMITGRKGMVDTKDGERYTLAGWVQPYLKDEGKLGEIVDPKLQGKIEEDELYKACNIASACLKWQPSSRPLASELVTMINQLVIG